MEIRIIGTLKLPIIAKETNLEATTDHQWLISFNCCFNVYMNVFKLGEGTNRIHI